MIRLNNRKRSSLIEHAPRLTTMNTVSKKHPMNIFARQGNIRRTTPGCRAKQGELRLMGGKLDYRLGRTTLQPNTKNASGQVVLMRSTT